MAESRPGSHPDLEALADFAAGALAAAVAVEVEAHVAGCPRCRLEVARLRRFAALDDDAELAADADWPRAAAALDAVYAGRIAPAARSRGNVVGRIGRIGRQARRWYVPVAAAAVLALVLLAPRFHADLGAPRGAGPVRGGGTQVAGIVAVAPVGELGTAPAAFTWRATEKFDAFALEVLTPRLERVFRIDGIHGDTVAAPDSLRKLCVAGHSYLWSVKGYRGVAEAGASAYAWFSIAEPRP